MSNPMNMSKCLTLLFALLFSTQAFSMLPFPGDLPEMEVSALEGRKFSLKLTGLNGGAAIRLMDAYGETLLSEDVDRAEKKYGKIFNLARLTQGEYLLVVSMNQKEVRQGLEINNRGEVVISPDDRQVYLVPTIRLGEEYVDVNWFNGKASDMKVEVQRANGEVVFEEDLEEVTQVGRRYNVSKLAEGDYVFIVRTPYNAHYQRLIVE